MKRGMLVLVMLCGVAHAGPVYKWTDDKGRVHYSDRPVASAQKLNMGKKDPAAADGAAASSDNAAETAARRAEACQRKKDQLFTYENAASVTEVDSLGNKKEFNAEQKQRLIELTRQQIAEFCSPEPGTAGPITVREE